MKVEASAIQVESFALDQTKFRSVSYITILWKKLEFLRLCTRNTMEDEGIEDLGNFL